MSGIHRFGGAVALLVFGLLLLAAAPTFAGLNRHQILLVVNTQSPISQAIGDYYAQVRGIPADYAISTFHLTSIFHQVIGIKRSRNQFCII
mgnify:CR=1 FL=1